MLEARDKLQRLADASADWLYAQALKTKVDIITLATVCVVAWLFVIMVIAQVKMRFF